jgi:hypothetical protein
MLAAVLKHPDRAHAEALKQIQPFIDGVRVTRFEQTVACDRMWRLAIGDFEQGGAALADIRARVVITMME